MPFKKSICYLSDCAYESSLGTFACIVFKLSCEHDKVLKEDQGQLNEGLVYLWKMLVFLKKHKSLGT